MLLPLLYIVASLLRLPMIFVDQILYQIHKHQLKYKLKQ